MRLLLLSLLVAATNCLAANPDADQAGAAASKFIHSYLKANDGSLGYMEVVGWVKKSPLVTDSFKSALDKLYTNALREDPEMGYGADALLSSQDPPDRYEVASATVKGDTAVVILAGPKSNPQKLGVRLVRQDGKWLVNGSGDINP